MVDQNTLLCMLHARFGFINSVYNFELEVCSVCFLYSMLSLFLPAITAHASIRFVFLAISLLWPGSQQLFISVFLLQACLFFQNCSIFSQNFLRASFRSQNFAKVVLFPV